MTRSFIRDRTDISEWLIHFVRDRDPDNDFPGDEETYEMLVGQRLEPDAPAFSVLRAIIDCGGILPGYSLRGGKTTIYGGRPAVCLTEAPLYNFVKYVAERNRSDRCSHYGICLPKSEIFAAGGRPVIYGLVGVTAPRLIEDTQWARVIDPDLLPLKEQFRYAAYDPNRMRPLDWTHEREWRWVQGDEELDAVWREGHRGLDRDAALPLFRPKDQGGYFSRIGFLVQDRDEANALAQLLLAYADSGSNNHGEPFSRSLIQSAFVVPLDEVEARGFQRIEDLAEDMRITASRPSPSAAMRAHVRAAVASARKVSTQAAQAFLQRTRGPTGHIRDVAGGAWVVTYDPSSEVTAALLEEGLAESMAGQFYIVHALGDITGDQALSLYEAGARAAAELLQAVLGHHFGVKTWWD